MERDCLQHTSDDGFHDREVDASDLTIAYKMPQKENRTERCLQRRVFFAPGPIEAVSGHEKLITLLESGDTSRWLFEKNWQFINRL